MMEPEKMVRKIRIFIADDHQLFIDGLRLIFAGHRPMKLLVQEVTGTLSLSLQPLNPVDVVITDINMPGMDGITATEKIKAINPYIRVIAVSMVNEYASVHKMLQSGADGYVLKNAGADELFKALEFAEAGEVYINKEVSDVLLKGIRFKSNTGSQTHKSHAGRPDPAGKRNSYFHRKGFSNQQIADQLCISIPTVKTHRSNILGKCDVKNTASLVRIVMENNLLH